MVRTFDARNALLGILDDAKRKAVNENPYAVMQWVNERIAQVQKQQATIDKYNSSEGKRKAR